MNCKIKPLSHRIIVEERSSIKKVGMIELPSDLVSKGQNEITEGIIIEMAEDAFDYIDANKPCVGDVVHFIKYDGIGKCYNQRNYRILMDDSVWGISKKYIDLNEDLIDG